MIEAKYKETVNYQWVLARQLDRVLEKRARVTKHQMRFERELAIAEYEAALYALWLALPDEIRRRVTMPRAPLETLDETMMRIVDELDKAKLLIRKSVVPVGGELGEQVF